MSTRTKYLLTNAPADSTSKPHKMVTGEALLSWGGTFAGETVTLETNEQGNWEPVTNGVFTSAGQRVLRLAQDIEVRAVVSNGGGTPSINVSLTPRF